MLHRLVRGLVLLVCACSLHVSLCGQTREVTRPPKKLVQLPLSGDFIQVAQKVLEASDKKFEPIRGPALPGRDWTLGDSKMHDYYWRTSLPLPGSDECKIVQLQSGLTGTLIQASYDCKMFAAAADTIDVFNAASEAIRAALGPGYVISSEDTSVPGETMTTHQFCEVKEPCPVGRAFVSRYTFLSDPQNSTIQITIAEHAASARAQGGPSSDRQGEALVASLPEARFTRRRTDLDGLAANTLVNRTAYELKLEFDGPEHHRISIRAGGSRMLTIPPGVYSITGSIPSQGVVEFRGAHTYAPDSEYQTEFYIQ